MVALVKQTAPEGSDLLSQYRVTGSPEIFAQIMRAYGGMVFSVCLKVTKVPADAEDASQATFLTLAVQCKTGAMITYLGPWLKKVAKRTALDLVRSRKRRTRRETVTAENRPEFFAERPAMGAENSEISQIIRYELDQLPAKYRMPLVLHYFGGLSHDQISQEMRCTTAALGVRLHRARKMLGKRLTARGINLERGALGAAIVVAIQQVVTDHFVRSTQQATFAMAWAHPASAVATLPHHLGDITNLVANVASSMARARMRMAAVTMAGAITMLGGAAEAVRHLPESIRPSLEFLAPSKAIESLFQRVTPSLRSPFRVEADTEKPADSYATASAKKPVSNDNDEDDYKLAAGSARPIPLAPPLANPQPTRQQTLTSQVPTPHAPPPTSPPRHSPVVQAAPQQSTVSKLPVTREPSRPVPLASFTRPDSTANAPASSNGGGGSSSDTTAKGPSAPPPLLIPAATSEQRAHRINRMPPAEAGFGSAAQSSFNVAPGQNPVAHFEATALDGTALAMTAGPIVPDFSVAGTVANSFVVGSGDVFVHSGDGTYQWSDPDNGILTGGVNSVTVAFDDVATGGVMSIERLSVNTTNAPARPGGHKFIGVWSMATTFDYSDLSLNVRYDDTLAQSLGLSENILKLWVYEADHWVRIMDGTFARNLDDHTLHGAFNGSIEFFAVSAPEPVGVVSFLMMGAAVMLRRTRRDR